jgi:ribosomal protein S18 acetylase RimI-like enzyme
MCISASPSSTYTRSEIFAKQISEFTKQTFLETQNAILIEREEREKQLLHFELYKQSPIPVQMMPRALRGKPLAKVGIRTYSAPSTDGMGDFLKRLTHGESNGASADPPNDFSIGLFVYMWVDEGKRGEKIGEFLLHLAASRFMERGNDFMLIVHDDNGSGKLVQYYRRLGFLPIFHILDKGMVVPLKDHLAMALEEHD